MTTTRLLALAVLIVAGLAWRSLYAGAATNLGSVTVMNILQCPDSATCQTGMDLYHPLAWTTDQQTNQLTNKQTNQLTHRANQLTRALRIAPGADSVRYRLAETLFALGKHDEAAGLLPPVELRLPDVQGELTTYNRTRLLTPGRYEGYLIAAYQHMAAGNWDTAILAFRLALSVGAEYLTPADHQAYFEALAWQHAQQAEQGSDPAGSAYLAGKYFARAGRWDQAETWLKRAIETTGRNDLTATEQARTWTYLGLAREQIADLAAARTAYETAVDLAPTLVEPHARLLALLRRLNDAAAAERVASTLAGLGPTYRLGQFAEGYAQPTPATLPNGRTLVGYDLDEESLEAGGQLELWLWWKGPTAQSTHHTGLSVGNFWIEQQTIVNLAGNPGFSWGLAANSLPLGLYATYHTGTSKGISIVSDLGPQDEQTDVLQIVQGGEVGIKSFLIPVDSEALYLQVGWLKHDKRTRGKIGRQCFRADHPSDQIGHFWGVPRDLMWDIAEPPDDVQSEGWIQVAHVGPPYPNQSVAICQLYFERESNTAEFDQVLFAKLEDTTADGE